MSIAYIVVTVLAASAAAISAIADLLCADWLLDNVRKYGVPEWASSARRHQADRRRRPPDRPRRAADRPRRRARPDLYFFGAVITVVRARWYSHVIFPLPFLLLAVSSLAMFAAA